MHVGAAFDHHETIVYGDQILSGLGLRGADWGFDEPHQALFDRKTIVLPDVVALADATPALALKPVFDLMWHAAGFAGSRNYNAAGAWAPS